MNVTNLTPQEKEQRVKDLLDFHIANPNISAIFKLNALQHIAMFTNSKSKDISGTRFSIPNSVEIDTERDGEARRERIFWNGADDIFQSVKKYTDVNGVFNMPATQKGIYGNGNSLQVKANTLDGKRLIQYLLFVSMFYQNGEYLTYDDGGYKAPNKGVSASEKQVLFNLIDTLKESTEGFEYLKGVKDGGMLNAQTDLLNAILSRKNGKDEYIEFLKNSLDVDFHKFKDVLLPFKDVKELYTKAKESKAIDYNKETKAYMIKGVDGKFIADSTILITSDKDTAVVDVLIMAKIKSDEKIKNKLSLILNK